MEDKGFLFFHDWASPLRQLAGDEFKELFFAMYDFQTEGKEPPKYDGTLGIIGAFVFPQLERRKASIETGRAGAQKRWSKIPPNSTPNRVPNGVTIPQDKTRQDQTRPDEDYTPSGGVGDEGFERFWSIYPKKTGKDAAREAYNALSVTDVDELCRLVERWKSSAEWKREGGRYVKQAAKFLEEIFPERVNPPGYNEAAEGFWNEAVEVELRRRMI